MLEFILGLFGQLGTFNNLALIGAIFIALIIAFKVFQFFIKAATIGLLFGLLAIVLWYFGFAVTMEHVLIAVLFGILFSIAYSAISLFARALTPKKKSSPKKEEKG